MGLGCRPKILKSKEVYNLIKISKSDAIKLNKDYGIPYGNNGISHTVSNVRTYYLCESEYNMKMLRRIKKI